MANEISSGISNDPIEAVEEIIKKYDAQIAKKHERLNCLLQEMENKKKLIQNVKYSIEMINSKKATAIFTWLQDNNIELSVEMLGKLKNSSTDETKMTDDLKDVPSEKKEKNSKAPWD